MHAKVKHAVIQLEHTNYEASRIIILRAAWLVYTTASPCIVDVHILAAPHVQNCFYTCAQTHKH